MLHVISSIVANMTFPLAKKVCIVGAGPSGLVAAKSLLHDVPRGTFEVTIFEAKNRIGGIWPSDRNDTDGLVHPLMAANQSKHTVQFSDLAWPADSPEIPRAWHIGQYLRRYFNRYCTNVNLHLGFKVESAQPVTIGALDHNGSSQLSGWRIQARSSEGEVKEETFDFLIVASGYFSKPAIPEFRHEKPDTNVPMIHSSQFSDLQRLFDKKSPLGGKILVVGGQMSGVEIASTIAIQLSSAMHSPSANTSQAAVNNPRGYAVCHLIQKPLWILPSYISPKPDEHAPRFLPLDLVSFNLSRRPQPLTNTQGHISEDLARDFHRKYQTSLGTDQSEFCPKLTITASDTTNPPLIAISDYYLDLVRSGLITVCSGKLEALSGSQAIISPSGEHIDDIAAVVFATGFEAWPSLSFLAPLVLEVLSVRPSDLYNTVALGFHGTYHPEIPNLGFVGFYRGPYWGIMEMQARFLSSLWASGGPSSPRLPQSLKDALNNDTSLDRTIRLRSDSRSSQFPMGDYVWLMEQFASALGINRQPMHRISSLSSDHDDMDILTPARYPSKSLSEVQQAEVSESLRQTRTVVLAGISSAKFVARAVFRSLLGEWKVERDIRSRSPNYPAGYFTGTAKFLLRQGTREGHEVEFDALIQDGYPSLEYLYVEEGVFKAENGLEFPANRRYVWRYNEKTDKLSIWHIRANDRERLTVENLFHEIEFTIAQDSRGSPGWAGRGSHLCGCDFYKSYYLFNFKAVNLVHWKWMHVVKGPKKDYTLDAKFIR